jgi:hypothetical protein
MSYYKKYLKYKNKYLELKKQLGGRRVKTIPNSGVLEGMTNQCFWISILNYLQRNGHPALTLRQLRTRAGLGADTEHTMFDIDHRNRHGHVDNIFYNAATRIANLYNLRIQVYSVDQRGEILGGRAHIGDDPNNPVVEIAQFGLAHFELINGVGGAFQPAVVVKGKLTKVINQKMKPRYLELSEHQGFLKILEKQLKEDADYYYSRILKERDDINSSNVFTPEEKEIFLREWNTNKDKFVLNYKAKEKKIKQLKEEISSLTLIISEFEKN